MRCTDCPVGRVEVFVEGRTPALACGASVETTYLEKITASWVTFGLDTGWKVHPSLLDHRGLVEI